MKNKGIINENKVAALYDGITLPASGATWVHKGDIKTSTPIFGYRGMLFQNKKTGKKSYAIKETEMDELEDQAIADSRMPVFRIEFGDKKGIIVLPEWLFQEILYESGYKD